MAFASSLDQIGSIGLDAHDCAILLNEICGYDFHDGTSSKLEVPDFTAKIGESAESDSSCITITRNFPLTD